MPDPARSGAEVHRIVSVTATPAIGEAKPQARPLKFDYLVAQRFITRDQLQAAIAEAAGQQVSVESLGYRGREAIHELLIASDEIKAMIVARSRVPRDPAPAGSAGGDDHPRP